MTIKGFPAVLSTLVFEGKKPRYAIGEYVTIDAGFAGKVVNRKPARHSVQGKAYDTYIYYVTSGDQTLEILEDTLAQYEVLYSASLAEEENDV